MVSHTVKTTKLLTKARCDVRLELTFPEVSEGFEGQNFKAQKLVLSGARMRVSRLKMNFIKNDFYGQYLHLVDDQ